MDSRHDDAPRQYPKADMSAGPVPLRRPGSIRRSSSIDSDRSSGFGLPWTMTGFARDILTPFSSAAPVVLATGAFDILTSPERQILTIAVAPQVERMEELMGVRAGGASRKAMASTLSNIRGSPTFQLLDDFAGASLVSDWILSHWPINPHVPGHRGYSNPTAGRRGNMIDICTGFAAGSASYLADGTPDYSKQSSTKVGSLENPQDRAGLHPMPQQEGPASRRARFVDMWREGSQINVEAGLQDSGTHPDGGRIAIHEYRVHAKIDEATSILDALEVRPLILPYPPSPLATMPW